MELVSQYDFGSFLGRIPAPVDSTRRYAGGTRSAKCKVNRELEHILAGLSMVLHHCSCSHPHGFCFRDPSDPVYVHTRSDLRAKGFA